MAAQDLREKLRMTHLEEATSSVEALKAAVEASVMPSVDATPSGAPDPRDQEEWPFPFSFTDRRGKVWSGTFTNAILTVRQQQLVAVFRARLAGGQPFDALDPSIADLNLAVAHMSYSLTATPDWAKDLTELRDTDVIVALYEKVRSHEDRYFRRGAPPAAS